VLFVATARERIAAAQLKCSQGKASLARNDVHLLGYSISGTALRSCSWGPMKETQRDRT
jgi:hypothetical protein